jgi:trk system potassium uptake protein TrkA
MGVGFLVYDIIVGVGRLGEQLAKFLLNANHSVVLVEKDKDRCKAIASAVDALVLNGDGTDITTLKDAGVEKTDNFVAVTAGEEVNLLTCLLARRLGAKRTIARISDPSKEELFKNVGIDAVVNPEVAAAIYLEKLIMRPGVLDLIVLGRGNAEILEIKILPNMDVLGKKIDDVRSEKYNIIAIIKGDGLTIPTKDTVLREGDRILVLALSDSISELERIFGKLTK